MVVAWKSVVGSGLLLTVPKSPHASPATAFCPTSKPFEWLDAGKHRDRLGRSLWLGRPRRAHTAALLYQRTEHRVEPQIPAQDRLGARESGGVVPVHVARCQTQARTDCSARTVRAIACGPQRLRPAGQPRRQVWRAAVFSFNRHLLPFGGIIPTWKSGAVTSWSRTTRRESIRTGFRWLACRS
jgi:hypothetical protein